MSRLLIAAVLLIATVAISASPLLEDSQWIHVPAMGQSMRLAQVAQAQGSDPYNVGLSTTKKEAHFATLDTRVTWKQAARYCGKMGYRLCDLKEICPSGEGNDPVGADELPDKQVFIPIRGPKSQRQNVYVAATKEAGDGVCTRKISPDFGTSKANPPKGTTKSIVACCATKFLQGRGVSAGVIKTIRASNDAAERFFGRSKKRSYFEKRRKEKAEKERKEREEKERQEKERKQKEEDERKRKEEEARKIQWDTDCQHHGVSINGKVATGNLHHHWRTARSKQIYREGVIKLAVKVTWMPNHHMMVGFVQADQSCHSHSFVHHIYNGGRGYYTHGGSTLYPHWQNYGQRYFAGDTIGAVLDFNRGTITFYKNGNSMGQAYGGVHTPQHFAVSFYQHGTVETVAFEGNY